MGLVDVEHLPVFRECHNIGVQPRNLLPPIPPFPPALKEMIFGSENPFHLEPHSIANGCFRDSLYLFPISLAYQLSACQNGLSSLLLKQHSLSKYIFSCQSCFQESQIYFLLQPRFFYCACPRFLTHPPRPLLLPLLLPGRAIFYRLFLLPYLELGGGGSGRDKAPTRQRSSG